MTTPESELPWAGIPRTLDLPTEEEFSSFISTLISCLKHIATTYYFDTVTYITKLHSKFRSAGNTSLEEVASKIALDEFTGEKNLTCIGMALAMKDIIVKRNPEWEDCVAIAISNKWENIRDPPDSFWTDNRPPLFPEQCREHLFSFIRVSLNHGRRAVVLLDPAHCLSAPFVITEDGLPPQSPIMKIQTLEKTREYTVSWGGPDYMRLVVEARTLGFCLESQHRVYVGRRFEAEDYLKWYEPIFPHRVLLFKNTEGGLGCFLRIQISNSMDHAVVCVNDPKQTVGECSVPFLFHEEDLTENQKLAMDVIAEKIGKQELRKLMTDLSTALNDKDFVKQFLDIWKKNREETNRSFENYFN